jgi:hypothetical protein
MAVALLRVCTHPEETMGWRRDLIEDLEAPLRSCALAEEDAPRRRTVVGSILARYTVSTGRFGEWRGDSDGAGARIDRELQSSEAIEMRMGLFWSCQSGLTLFVKLKMKV